MISGKISEMFGGKGAFGWIRVWNPIHLDHPFAVVRAARPGLRHDGDRKLWAFEKIQEEPLRMCGVRVRNGTNTSHPHSLHYRLNNEAL